MSAPDFNLHTLTAALNTIVNNRTHMFRNNLCEVTPSRTASLQKIKRYMDHGEKYKLEGKIKMLVMLTPDFENIMPGESSKYYPSIVGKWNWIKENLNVPHNPTPQHGI